MRDSWASTPAIRKTMQGNKGRDTKPELAVRRLLHARGFRYRINYRPEKDLRRTADIVFTRAKVAVFIDGCYWHGCPEHYIAPTTNGRFWSEKIETNRARDAETTRVLQDRGWAVLRHWEHENTKDIVQSISTAVLLASSSTRVDQNATVAPFPENDSDL